MWTANDIPDQRGKTVIVTGANTGIGFETAKALYLKGATVILAGRNESKITDAIERIAAAGGKGQMEPGLLDLASLASVRDFAEEFAANHTQLDILVNNAGIMMCPPATTAEGFELQFGTNFMGHYALTILLLPLLQKAPAARVVTVSSLAYLSGHINFDNLRSEQSYDPVREYAQSKLANLLFAVELQRRLQRMGSRVISIAAQPGANDTELARHMSREAYDAALERFGKLMEPWQGALPQLFAATAPDAIPGALYGPHEDGIRGYPAEASMAPNALDKAVASRLWTLAEEIMNNSLMDKGE